MIRIIIYYLIFSTLTLKSFSAEEKVSDIQSLLLSLSKVQWSDEQMDKIIQDWHILEDDRAVESLVQEISLDDYNISQICSRVLLKMNIPENRKLYLLVRAMQKIKDPYAFIKVVSVSGNVATTEENQQLVFNKIFSYLNDQQKIRPVHPENPWPARVCDHMALNLYRLMVKMKHVEEMKEAGLEEPIVHGNHYESRNEKIKKLKSFIIKKYPNLTKRGGDRTERPNVQLNKRSVNKQKFPESIDSKSNTSDPYQSTFTKLGYIFLIVVITVGLFWYVKRKSS